MFAKIAQSLIGICVLLAVPAWGDDLPMLQTENLPSLSLQTAETITLNSEMYSVECYLGNPNQGNSVGNITTTSAGNVGSECNRLFYVCKGACYGCFTVFDFSDEICVDNAGKKYLR